MNIPPKSNMLDTPSEPRLSTFPKPIGKLAVGGRRDQDTVARVRTSDAKSVRECQASAIMDWELKA